MTNCNVVHSGSCFPWPDFWKDRVGQVFHYLQRCIESSNLSVERGCVDLDHDLVFLPHSTGQSGRWKVESGKWKVAAARARRKLTRMYSLKWKERFHMYKSVRRVVVSRLQGHSSHNHSLELPRRHSAILGHVRPTRTVPSTYQTSRCARYRVCSCIRTQALTAALTEHYRSVHRDGPLGRMGGKQSRRAKHLCQQDAPKSRRKDGINAMYQSRR